MFCTHCGAPGDNKRFCTQCGAALLRVKAPTVPVSSLEASQVLVPQLPVSGPMPGAAAMTGRMLEHKYYLESKLGVGGMGTVYRARRLLIGDAVAIKVLHPDQLDDPQAIERFRREAQTAALLKHPNVVNIYDFGISPDGLVYLVMELVEGENLRQMIERQGTVGEEMAAEIVRQICAAMGEAHRQDVIHRDIKPENILVQMTPSGLQVKVLDFGIAALRDIAVNRLTQPGNILGTPSYMSPEQCMGEELDGRSDIYSLGIVLFEMLTGVVPFYSPTTTAIVVQQVNQAPPPLRSLNPNISSAVEAVVLHTLEKQREYRPQTASDMARDLIAAVNGLMVVPPLEGTVPTEDINPVPVASPAVTSSFFLDTSAPETASTFNGHSATDESGSPTGLLIFAVLLLLAVCVGGGFWWYLQKNGNGEVAVRNDSNQPSATANAQPVALDRNTVGDRTAASSVTKSSSSPATNNLWEVIPDQTNNTVDAINVLGAMDGQTAVIKPGGQLALNYREGQFFGDGTGADIRVYGPKPDRVSYLIYVRNSAGENWKLIDKNRRGFPRGVVNHDVGHHQIQRARQIMIKNNGNVDLNIDAITVIHKDEAHGENDQRRRR